MAALIEEFNKKKEDLSTLYLIIGTEAYSIEKFVKKVQDTVLDTEMVDFNTLKLYEEEEGVLKRLEGALNTMPMLGGQRLVLFYVQDLLRGKGKKETGERFLSLLEKRSPSTYLLIITEEVDKRIRVYKQLKSQGRVLEAQPLQGRELHKWLHSLARKNGKKLDVEGIEYLEYAFLNQLHYLENELNKVFLYVGEKETITLQDIKAVIAQDRVLHEKIIFDWVDTVSQGQVQQALELMGEMLQGGTNIQFLLTMLTRQIRLLALVWELQNQGYSQKRAATILGEHPYPVKKCYGFARRFSYDELEFLWQEVYAVSLRALQGKMDWRPSIELFLLKWQEYRKGKTRSHG